MQPNQREHLISGRGYEIRGGEFDDKILSIGTGEVVDSIRSGAVFRNCELRIVKTTRQHMDFDASFIRSEVRPKVAVRNKQMTNTRFLECKFFGRYIGCEFGPKFQEDGGHVESCDFSAARLHLTAFYGCSLGQVHLPDWPHIYLVNDNNGRWNEQLSSVPLPPTLAALARLERSDKVSQVSILAFNLEDEGMDSERIWPLIQDKTQVWFPGKSSKPRADTSAISSAEAANEQDNTDLARSRERSRVFHLLHRSWLRKSMRVDASTVDLVFDTSFLRQRVGNAPDEVRVRLHGGVAQHRSAGESRELDASVDRFMLMGVAMDGDDIVLKPHRKERGQVMLSFDSYSVWASNGESLSCDELLKVVEAYLRRT